MDKPVPEFAGFHSSRVKPAVYHSLPASYIRTGKETELITVKHLTGRYGRLELSVRGEEGGNRI